MHSIVIKLLPCASVVARCGTVKFLSKSSKRNRSLAPAVGALEFPLENIFNRSNDFLSLFDNDDLPFASNAMPTNMNMDIKETDSDYELMVDMPGVDKKDIKLSVNNDNLLTLAFERHTVKDEDSGKFKRMERFSGRVSRTLRLPEAVEVDKIDAQCTDGVLHVKIPKSPEHEKAVEPKTIEIK